MPVRQRAQCPEPGTAFINVINYTRMTSIKMSAGKNVYIFLIRLIVTSTLSGLNVEQNKTLTLRVPRPETGCEPAGDFIVLLNVFPHAVWSHVSSVLVAASRGKPCVPVRWSQLVLCDGRQLCVTLRVLPGQIRARDSGCFSSSDVNENTPRITILKTLTCKKDLFKSTLTLLCCALHIRVIHHLDPTVFKEICEYWYECGCNGRIVTDYFHDYIFCTWPQ